MRVPGLSKLPLLGRRRCCKPRTEGVTIADCAGCGTRIFNDGRGAWKPVEIGTCPFGA